MNEALVLGCQGLKKSFHEGVLSVEVLRGVDLAVLQGQCIGIVGASGSGKSTLLHLLGGLDTPSAGTVTVKGRTLQHLGEPALSQVRNRTLAFVYQFHHLLPEFTALENVAMPLLVRGEDTATVKQQAGQMLADVGLADRRRHKPAEMSGGERQRVAIARALISRPACLLADEPTGNLDEKTAQHVFELLLALNKTHAVSMVMVTHNLSLLNNFDAVYELTNGQLCSYAG